MSAYPECQHGFSDPMGTCPQCATERELSDLRSRAEQAEAQLEEERETAGAQTAAMTKPAQLNP